MTGLLDLSPGPIVSSFWEQLARARDARSALLACMRVSRALRDIARPLFASLLVCDSMTVAFRVLYRDLSAVRTLVIYDLRHGQKADVLRACPFITTLATSAWPAVSLPISCRQIAVGNVHARDDAWVRLPTGLTRFALGHVERAYLDVPFVNLRSVTLNEEALVIFRSCKSLVNLHSLRLQEHRRPLDAFKIIAFSSIVRLYIDCACAHPYASLIVRATRPNRRGGLDHATADSSGRPRASRELGQADVRSSSSSTCRPGTTR